MNKICSKCKETKPLNQFHKSPATKDGHLSVCKVCKAAYMKIRYGQERLKLQEMDAVGDPKAAEYRALKVRNTRKWQRNNRDRHNQIARNWRRSVVMEAIVAYGGKCYCCGESNSMFLTLDHINNNGAEEKRTNRATISLAYWARRNNWPDTLQLACYNCNCGRYRNGGICPHQQKTG